MLTIEDRSSIRRITLSNPDRRNAVDEAALTELRTAIEDTAQPVVYIHGEGEAFCAGADLAWVRSVANDRDAALELARMGQATMDAIEDADPVVIAGIDGAARGGGVELALACDIRIATPTATLAESGVDLGMFGAWGGTRRLPRIVGDGHALDLAVSGRVIDADTALHMGLVSRVTPTPETVATEIAAGDGAAITALKRLLRTRTNRGTANDHEAQLFADLAPGAADAL